MKHLYGSLYLMPFGDLHYPNAEPVIDGEEIRNYEFSNPRLATNKGQADMLDKQKSREMRESIKVNTLLNPFICRWVEIDKEKRVQIVGGDRRRMALEYLISKKEMVKDARVQSSDSKYAPANEVYSHVMCHIFDAESDLDALALAHRENACRVNLTEGHLIANLIELRKCQASDEKILEIVGRDGEWLAKIDRLINGLDQETLTNVIEDKLDFKGAIELLEITDLDARKEAFSKANEYATENHKKRWDRLKQQAERVFDKKEMAAGRLVEAEFRHDEVLKEIATKQLEEASAAAEEIQVKIATNKANNPVTRTRDVKRAIREVSGEVEVPRCLKPKEIEALYLNPLLELIENNGLDVDGEYNAPLDSLKMAAEICKAILNGDKDGADCIVRDFSQLCI